MGGERQGRHPSSCTTLIGGPPASQPYERESSSRSQSTGTLGGHTSPRFGYDKLTQLLGDKNDSFAVNINNSFAAQRHCTGSSTASISPASPSFPHLGGTATSPRGSWGRGRAPQLHTQRQRRQLSQQWPQQPQHVFLFLGTELDWVPRGRPTHLTMEGLTRGSHWVHPRSPGF